MFLRSTSKGLAIFYGLCGAAGVATAALTGDQALAYLRKDPDDDESAARNKEEAMKARFDDWVNKNNKTYRNEVEKVGRFQAFKDTIKWIESQPLSTQKELLPELSYFADYTVQERQRMTLGPDAENSKELQEELKEIRAMREKGELSRRKQAVKQGDTRPSIVPSILLTCNFCTKTGEFSRAVKQGDTRPKVSA